MRLTLTCRGSLPPTQKGMSSVKADLRRAFHRQIKSQVGRLLTDKSQPYMTTFMGGHEFISPAHKGFWTAVELDVPILTRNLIRPGDVDNRLKTLIDGLTRSANPQQLQSFSSPAEGGATFCLLDDDRLVDRVAVDTRVWHEPGLATNEALVVATAKLVLHQEATMNTPMHTLFFLVS